jgi:hypothetical protein
MEVDAAGWPWTRAATTSRIANLANLKSAMMANLKIRDPGFFSVACLSPTFAARCDELREQDTGIGLSLADGDGRWDLLSRLNGSPRSWANRI